MELEYEKFGQYVRDILQYLNYKYDLDYNKVHRTLLRTSIISNP